MEGCKCLDNQRALLSTKPKRRANAEVIKNAVVSFLFADNAELTQRQDQACSQRSESPRFPEESLHLGMSAAVDQVL
jgi:hypothetical protein